jgi:hypothetical protein
MNVHVGTQLHKGIIKGYMMQQLQQRQQQQQEQNSCGNNNQWIESMQLALQQQLEQLEQPQQQQLPNNPPLIDFFPFIRRVMLQTTIDVMIGTFFGMGGKMSFWMTL